MRDVAEADKSRSINGQAHSSGAGHLHAMLDQAPSIAFARDSSGRFVYCNRRALSLMGLTTEQCIGLATSEIASIDVALRLDSSDREVLESGVEQTATVRFPAPDGSHHLWVGFKFPFSDSAGIRYVGGIAVDITAHGQIEEELQREKQRLTAVLDTRAEIEQSDGSLNTIMQVVADRTRAITGARGAAIGLIADDGSTLIYHAVSGHAESYLGDRFDLSYSPSGICLRERRPFYAADTETDLCVDARLCRAVSVRSLLIVPILHKSVNIGVITVVDALPNAFDEWDVNTLELMAGTIGAALSQAIANELSERRARGRADALEQLRRSEERFRAATEGSLDAFLILEWMKDEVDDIVDFACVDANARAETLLGKARTEIVGRTVANVLGKRDADRLKPAFLRAVSAGATIEHEQRIRIRGVKAQWIRYQIVPITQGVAVTCRDITERRTSERLQSRQLARIREVNAELQRERAALEEANARLELLARVDGLTSVYNHRGFREILDQEYWRCVRYNRPLSVVVLDLDKFKPYNDAFGHPAGDEALRKVAELLKSTAREADSVARTGGEEFVVVLPNTSARGAIITADRFRQALTNAEWQLRTVTASFGVSSLTVTTRDSQELMTRADRALYVSKRRGGNCVTHADELDAASTPGLP